MQKLAIIIGFLFAPVSVFANDVPTEFLGRFVHEDAPEEVHYWGRLLGDWDIRWEAYDEHGGIVRDGKASWHWYSTLGGFAIQDFYTHPMPPERGRDRVGTNLRIFDTEQKKWLIRWSHNFGAGFEEFTAVQDDNQVIMYQDGAEATSRIRFFNFQDNSFRQQEEKSDDGGKTWRPSFSAWAARMSRKPE